MIKVCNYVIQCLILLFFGSVLVSSLFYNSNVYYADDTFFSLVFSVIVLFLWFFIFYLFIKKDKFNFLIKNENIFLLIYFLIILFIQYFVIKELSVEPSWDFGVVFSNAKYFAINGARDLTSYPEYFQLFPNNILLFVLEVIFIKIGLVFSVNPLYSCYAMNILFIDLAILMLYLSIKNFYNKKYAIYALILLLFFIPIFLYTPIIYSDTLSLFIPISFIYLFSLLHKKDLSNKTYYIIFIIMGVLLFLGKEIKITSLIIFIAIVLNYLFVKFSFRKVINIGISLIILIILEVGFKFVIVNNSKYQFQVNGYGAVPITHWIMMGVEDIDRDNSDRNSYGGYSFEDYELTQKYNTGSDAVGYNISETFSRIKKMGLVGYEDYLLRKSVNTWTDGYYFSNIKLGIKSYNKDGYLYKFLFVNDSSTTFMRAYTQGVQYSVLLVFIFSSIMKFKNNKDFDYLKLTLIGLFIFFLMWENRSRYIFNYIPVFIVVIIDYYYILKYYIDDKKIRNNN